MTTMAHNPINHPLRPLYRLLAILAGGYLVVFGVIGLIVSSGAGLLDQPDDRVLGQGTNLLWSIVSLVFGAVVVLASLAPRNIGNQVQWLGGWTLLVIGTYELATSRTDANFLKFTIATVVVTYLVGLALVLAGLYTKVGASDEAGAPRQVREGRTA
ncbi:DUF4383 domain-containing protein [Actinoplanes sp. NPDC051633]|uniref:DUF4383 domain-containing protein n=1 Tax=Actinoplanes sp. NPDC051633 TaxID=3155670 RepID=UPI00343BC07D